ncbi:MAG TPA: hypothetical protein VIJ63_05785 [Roseiarcus sp.]
MENHKFTYTVSGVKLSDEQKHEISQAISSAVTNALIGHSSKSEIGHSAKAGMNDTFSLIKIWGGIWARPGELGDAGLKAVEALAER